MRPTREAVLAMAEDTQATLADPGDRSADMLHEMREDVEVYRALLALDDAANRLITRCRARAECPMCWQDMGDDDHLAMCELAALRAALLPREGER